MLRKIFSSLVIFGACVNPLLAEDYVSPQLTPQLERDFVGEWNPSLPGMNPSGGWERAMLGLCYRISGNWIRASGYVNLGEFLSQLPGMLIAQTPGSLGTSEDYLGLKPLIMTDGIQLDLPDGDMPDLNLIPLENVDYVEVYPGPLAGLYGNYSTVINIVTLHQRTEQANAYVMIADGSFDLERYKFAYSQSLSHYDFTLSGDRQLYTGFTSNIVDYSGGNLTLTSNLYSQNFHSLAGFSWSGKSQLTGEIYPAKTEFGLTRIWIAPQIQYGEWNLGGAYSYHRQKEGADNAQSHFFRLEGQYKPGSDWGWYNSLEGESSSLDGWKGGAISSLSVSLSSALTTLSGVRMELKAGKNYTITPAMGLSLTPLESLGLFTNFNLNFNHSPETGNSKSYNLFAGGKLYFLNRGQASLSAFYHHAEMVKRTGLLLDIQFRVPGNFTLLNSTSIYNQATNHQPKLQIDTQFVYNPSFNKQRFSLYAGLEHHYYSSGIAFSPMSVKSSIEENQSLHLWNLRFSVRVLSLEVFMLVENLLNSKVKSEHGIIPGYPRLYRVGFSWYFRN